MWIATGTELKTWRETQGWTVERASLWSGYSLTQWQRLETKARIPLPLTSRIRELEWRRKQDLPSTPY